MYSQNPRLNSSASDTHTTLQPAASRKETTWALRWKTPRSTARRTKTSSRKPKYAGQYSASGNSDTWAFIGRSNDAVYQSRRVFP